jgi:hypothetical protein
MSFRPAWANKPNPNKKTPHQTNNKKKKKKKKKEIKIHTRHYHRMRGRAISRSDFNKFPEQRK